jgi:hypothetical protein
MYASLDFGDEPVSFRMQQDHLSVHYHCRGKNDFNMLLKSTLGDTCLTSSCIFGLVKSRCGTGGAEGCVTLPMRDGNNALFDGRDE